MNYYTEPDSHITDKVKILLEESNYAAKKELEHSTCVNTSNLVVKSILLL